MPKKDVPHLQLVDRQTGSAGLKPCQRPLVSSALPPFVAKAKRLYDLKPYAAAVVEKLVDDLLSQFTGHGGAA